jgi:hypothetical protein
MDEHGSGGLAADFGRCHDVRFWALRRSFAVVGAGRTGGQMIACRMSLFIALYRCSPAFKKSSEPDNGRGDDGLCL